MPQLKPKSDRSLAVIQFGLIVALIAIVIIVGVTILSPGSSQLHGGQDAQGLAPTALHGN